MSGELPKGWVGTSVGELATVGTGATPKRGLDRYWNEGDIAWVTSGAVNGGRVSHASEYVTSKALEETNLKLYPPGTLLVAMYGEGKTRGKCAELEITACTNQALAAIQLPDNYPQLRSMLKAFLQRNYDETRLVASGGVQPNLNLNMVRAIRVPLPPLNEQKRIVAKIDALTEKSGEARQALDEVPALLDKLRQSILAAAFRGDLTKKWREQNPKVEPASVLLDRIRKERRCKWEEAELAKFKAKGKVPQDDKWKQKYQEPEPVDTEGLPELPEGWCWASVEMLAEQIVDCPHSTPKYGVGNHLAVDTTCILPGRVVTAKLRRLAAAEFEQRVRRLRPQMGDVVFAREGAVGTAAPLPSDPEVCLGQRVMLVRPSHLLPPGLIVWGLMAPSTRAQYEPDLVGSTVPHVNVGRVVRLALPLPPLAEQGVVLGSLERSLNILESLADATQDCRTAVDSVDAATLAKAFRGELVPQDPNDEPASVLLERIRQEREDGGSGKKSRGKKTQ